MRTMIVARFSVISSFAFFCFFVAVTPVSAATTVSGAIVGNVTWTTANSPYIASSVSVPTGASLTIEPGVIVKVPRGAFPFHIQGGTLTIGAPDAEHVVITSIADDTIGGDTDGVAASPARGDWYAINAVSGTVNIARATVRYGGREGAFYGQLLNEGAAVSISQSEFSDAFTSILIKGGTTEIRGSSFSRNTLYGIWQRGGNLRFGGNTFAENQTAVLATVGGTFQNDGDNTGTNEGIYIQSYTVSGNMALPADGLPYVILNLTVPESASLAILPGATVKIHKNTSPVSAYGSLIIGAENEEPVIITSLSDDTVGGDTNRDGATTAPARGDWQGINMVSGTAAIVNAHIRYGGYNLSSQLLNQGASVTIANAKFSDSAQDNIFQSGGSLIITDSEIANAKHGIVATGGNVTVHQSSFHDFVLYGIWNRAQTTIDATDNWWGDPSGPQHTTNPSGTGATIIGNVDFTPWLGSDPLLGCTVYCYSNVLFLPGIKASRLYKDGALGTEDQLWLPNLFGNDLEDLALDEDGQSRSTVYTRDVLDEIVTGNIYESFLNQLQNLKSDGTIEDYQAFAYDWRKNVEDIVREGTLYPEGVMRSAIADVQALSASSKSKKVTIVAHSNGGLFAKAMMLELEKQGVTDIVDKIVFVGTPQMGTPLAVLSLLYGYDEPIPVLLSQAEARTLAETMPGAYGLLPSEKYFDRVADPFITFSSERTRYKDFKDAYGEKINSFGEFGEFLSGSGDGRSEPDNDAVEMENTLREKFLTQAEETHGRLDGWVPPSDVEVIQIAGWGLDTVSGVEYAEKEKTRCYSVGRIVPSCVGTGEYEPVYDPKFTVDGDAVVVSPSALMLSEASNVKRYWVDLYRSNRFFANGREHKDILELDLLREFFDKIIKNTYLLSPLPNYFYSYRPDNYDGAASRLRMSLYSPLDIHLYDKDGRHTGPKKTVIDGHEVTMFEEGIPNSYYYRFGDRKYVGFGTGENVRVEMDGYAEGSYTLELEEVKTTIDGEEVIAHTVFENLPTTADTAVTLDIPETGLTDMTALEADIDGDGINDYAVAPVLNGTATLDVIAPTTEVSLAGTQGTNAWYVSDVAVTLTAVDDDGGSGVEKTEYSLDNETTWNTYIEPFGVSEENITDIQYFSIDKQGNREETKTMVVKIDKTAPEANIRFNPSEQKLDIIGKDTLSQSVSVATTEASVNQFPEAVSGKIKSWFSNWLRKEKKILVTTTLTDEAGHKTEIVFAKKKDKKRRIDLALQSISYDGAQTLLPNTLLQYKWQMDRQKKYRLFASHIRTDDNIIESHYVPKKDETILMEKPRELDDDSDDGADRRPTRTRLPGMVIPGILTEMGQVKVNY